MKKTLSFILLMAMILSAVSMMTFTSGADAASDARLQAAQAAVAAIPATVTLADRGAVLEAQAAYELLTEAEKATLSTAGTTIANALTALESAKDAADRGEGVHLSDIEWKSWIMDSASSEEAAPKYTPSKDMNGKGTVITFAGKEYPKGLRTHPGSNFNAVFEYDISAYDYTTFSATVGKGDEELANYGAIQFFVYGDGKLLAVSDYMDVGASCYIACDVTGVDILRIEVSPLEIHWCDSASLGYPMLSNRPVSEVDSNLKSYFTEKVATEASAGVVYNPLENAVILSGDAAYTTMVDPCGTHFAAVATTTSETPVTLSIASNGEVIDTVTVEKGTPLALNYPITFATQKMSSPAYKAIATAFTITADCGDGMVTLYNAKQYVPEDPANPVDPDPMPEFSNTVQLEGTKYGSGMENWANSSNKPEGHPAVFEILYGAKYSEVFNKAIAEAAFAAKDALEWTLTISKNADMSDATTLSLAPASWFDMGSYACFRFETALAETPWVPEVGVTYYINATVKGQGIDYAITGPADGFVMNEEPITKDYKAPDAPTETVEIEINPYEAGDIKGFENWSNQTQLLIRVDGGNTVDYSGYTWKITIGGKTITMAPSSDQAPWLYRFETCLGEGDNQFIPENGTEYTVSVEILNEAGEVIAKSGERAGFIPFQDPIVPEEPVDPPVDPGDDPEDKPGQSGDAAIYATIAVAVAAVALAVVFKRRATI